MGREERVESDSEIREGNQRTPGTTCMYYSTRLIDASLEATSIHYEALVTLVTTSRIVTRCLGAR